MAKQRRNKLKALHDRLEVEQARMLCYIDEVADQIEKMSAGQIYSPYGAEMVKRLDVLMDAENRLSEAITSLAKEL